jgi:phage tail-like protein
MGLPGPPKPPAPPRPPRLPASTKAGGKAGQSDSGPYYPPGAFYFQVGIQGTMLNPWKPTDIDASFQEISGLDREMEYEDVREGGENRFAHRLPKRGKHPNLVLKRGLVTLDSSLAVWAEETLASTLAKPIRPMTVQVMLLNVDTDQPLVTWTFSGAYPVKWLTAPLKSTDGAVTVETLELSYTMVERKT